MAPMIDMVFLLLVFFMCVSTLAQSEKRIEVRLPESVEARVPKDLSDRGTLSIDANGNIYLRGREATLDDVSEHIGRALSENPKTKVHLRVDCRTTFRHVRRLLRSCAENGAGEIIYSSYQAAGDFPVP